VLTVKILKLRTRPSVRKLTATDWFTDGYLKRCLMYSRTSILKKDLGPLVKPKSGIEGTGTQK